MSFPRDLEAVHNNPQAMLEMVVQRKEEKGREYISLPLFDVPFLRALGVDLSISSFQGVKVTAPLFNSAKDLAAASPGLTFDLAVFEPIYQTIDLLHEHDERVTYKLPSLLNLWEGILPFADMVKLTLKDPSLFQQVNQALIDHVQAVILDLDQRGVDLIFMFDSFGSLSMLGEAFYKQAYGPQLVDLFLITDQVQHSRLALANNIAQPLVHLGFLALADTGQLYTARQNRKGDIEVVKSLRIID